MICNITVSLITSISTHLQLCFGFLMADSKDLINCLHDFGVICTHDEVQRFKQSAAKATVSTPRLIAISD